MAPLVPRMHVFEFHDQTWFHPWFRGRVQAALTRAWLMRVPLLQRASPAALVADVLRREVLQAGGGEEASPASASSASSDDAAASPAPWIMIDFCSGGGGPTPQIERILNAEGAEGAEGGGSGKPTRFVLTDLHPHVDDWAVAAAASPNVRFAPQPVDATAADPAAIIEAAFPQARKDGLKKSAKDSVSVSAAPRTFRLFSLSFHHFDDPLARAILKNTVETSDGIGIFELQDRTFGAFLTTLVFGLGILLTAPYYAWRWRSPMTLVFTYLVPILPFVLVFDGWMSMLRTREPDEVAALLRTCGAESETDGTDGWELCSGQTRHLWPCGYLKWIIITKKAKKAT